LYIHFHTIMQVQGQAKNVTTMYRNTIYTNTFLYIKQDTQKKDQRRVN